MDEAEVGKGESEVFLCFEPEQRISCGIDRSGSTAPLCPDMNPAYREGADPIRPSCQLDEETPQDP